MEHAAHNGVRVEGRGGPGGDGGHDEWSHALSAVRIMLGFTWAGGMMLAGLWLWSGAGGALDASGGLDHALMRSLAVLFIAGAQFVFMVAVADEAFPRTPSAVTATLKLAAGLTVCGAMASAAIIGWRLMG